MQITFVMSLYFWVICHMHTRGQADCKIFFTDFIFFFAFTETQWAYLSVLQLIYFSFTIKVCIVLLCCCISGNILSIRYTNCVYTSKKCNYSTICLKLVSCTQLDQQVKIKILHIFGTTWISCFLKYQNGFSNFQKHQYYQSAQSIISP